MPFNIQEFAVVPAIKGLFLGRFGIENALFSADLDDMPLVTGYSSVHRQVFTVEHAAEEFAMVGTSRRLQIGSLQCKATDDLLWSSAFADFLFEVS